MGRGHFTKKEMDSLRKNPYVSDVNQTTIAYSSEFKHLFMNQYNAGRKPVQIFRDAGFDTAVLGSKRIERACARWKESYLSGTLGQRDAILGCGDQKKDGKSVQEQNRYNRNKLISQCREQEKTIRQLQAELQVMQKICGQSMAETSYRIPRKDICGIIQEVTEQEQYQACVSHLCNVTGISRSMYYRTKQKQEPLAERSTE